MEQRKIRRVLPAFRDDIADLHTFRPLPSPLIDQIDPFLFLNHHGPQEYSAPNHGLPFGPHPHRGFQTVTFILEGDIAHRDTAGHESIIGPGGVQWMNAGRGLVHEEVSSEEFKKMGGPLEILQLWVNLPRALKMSDPYYVGLQKDRIPVLELDEDKARLQIISGEWEGRSGPFKPAMDIALSTVELRNEGRLRVKIAEERSIFLYVVRGRVLLNGLRVERLNLVEFEHSGTGLEIQGAPDAFLLFGHGLPLKEPVAMGGPFVMNTEEEIHQAFRDFRAGRFGA